MADATTQEVMLWTARCKTCGEEVKFQSTREHLEAYLKAETYNCKVGHHVELSSPGSHLEVDWDNPQPPEDLLTDDQFRSMLKSKCKWVGDTQELSREFNVESFSMGLCVAHRKRTGEKVVLDFAHAPSGKRFYYLS